MIELTHKDREKLAQAPIGRLALKRIEDLEAELGKERALVRLLRARYGETTWDGEERR